MTLDRYYGTRVLEFELTDRLRKARESLGLNQGEFAELIGVHRDAVQRCEKGTIAPRKIVLNAWALATGVDREWLETGKYTPRDLNPEPTD